HAILLTDTVGFIQKLPPELIAAFRATLEEVVEADLLLHVVDISHPNAEEQIAAVEEVLEELGAGGKVHVTALNKVDLLDRSNPEDNARLQMALQETDHAVPISARTGEGIPALLAMLDEVLRDRMIPVDVLIPYNHSDLVALAHEHGFIEHEEHTAAGT